MLPAADAALPEQLPVCPEHPERPSLATCERCGRFLCEACAVTREPPRCADCHARVGDPLGILSQPFSVDRAFANGWTLFRRTLPSIIPVALLFGIPGGLLSHVVESNPSLASRSSSFDRIFDGTLGLVATGACLALMVGVAEGQRVSFLQALRRGFSSWPGLFGAAFRQGIQIIGYALLLIVPGIIRGVTLSLSTESAFREPGRDALQNSEQLVTGRRWEVFGMLAGSITISLAVVMGLAFCLAVMTNLAPSLAPFSAIALDAGSRLGTAFASAVSLCAFYGFKCLHGEPLEPR
jgi:hypothetical protein